MARGRPSSYTPEIADKICEAIASGLSVRKACESDGMPSRSTVLAWLNSRPEFRAKCARAWELQADALADQQLEVVDGVLSGKIDPQAGKVAVSTYQWLGSKRDPKKYGDRTVLAGDKENPLVISVAERIRGKLAERRGIDSPKGKTE